MDFYPTSLRHRSSQRNLPPDHDERADYLRLLELSDQEDFNPQHGDGGFHHVEAEHLSLHL